MKKKNKKLPEPDVHLRSPDLERMTRRGYGFGAVLCLLGLVMLSVALGQVLHRTLRGFYRVAVPGEKSLEFMQGVYLGIQPSGAAEEGPLELAGNLRDDGGNEVPLERMPDSLPVSLGAQGGRLLFRFTVEDAGRFALALGYPDGRKEPQRELMLIHETLQNNRADAAVGSLAFLGLAGFGVYILLMTRRRALAGAQEPGRKK